MTEDKKIQFKDRRALVVGMGKSGIAAVEALLEAGARVSVQDSKTRGELPEELAEHLTAVCERCFFGEEPGAEDVYDILILSPGVPPELGFIRAQKAGGAEISGELELAYRLAEASFISITGTNGKTTTTTLVGEIFRHAGRETYVVGNIGSAVVRAAAGAPADAWLVTETSSFQLETTRDFRPRVSAILNLTPDHLNRHHTMEAYGDAKAKTFANQSADEYCVFNYDDKVCFALSEKCRAKVVPFSRLVELGFGAFVKGDDIVIRDESGKTTVICAVTDLKIPGAHNVENALAAAAVAYFAGISAEDIAATLRSFEGVEHRLEYVDTVNGVRYVNDSKGTNPDSSIKAVEAMPRGIILIAGGYDKGSEYDELIKAFDGKVKKMLLLGVTAKKIDAAARACGFTETEFVKDMDEAVKRAYEIAVPGDTVLLSPACASWDMYSCFEERGEHFKQCVKSLR